MSKVCVQHIFIIVFSPIAFPMHPLPLFYLLVTLTILGSLLNPKMFLPAPSPSTHSNLAFQCHTHLRPLSLSRLICFTSQGILLTWALQLLKPVERQTLEILEIVLVSVKERFLFV